MRAEPGAAHFDLETLFAPVAAHSVLGLAVSGGADSLGLMILATRWAKSVSAPVRLVVYTVDHGLRAAAKTEIAYVCQCATALGLEVRVLHWTGAKPASGVQAAARAARYQLIGAAMAADGVEVLLTAHHMQDQAETVLMRLAHGSGLGGLGGMRAFSRVENVQLFRPLLSVSQQALLAEVKGAGLAPADDPSNADEAYERVRWRNSSEQLADLGLDAKALSLFAERADRADAALGQIALEKFDQLARIDALGVVTLDLIGWRDEVLDIQVRLLQIALRTAGGDFKPFGLQQIEKLAGDLAGDAPFAMMTLMGCVVARQAAHIEFSREAARVNPQSRPLLPGQKLVWDKRFSIANNLDARVMVLSGGQLTKSKAASFLGNDNFRARHVNAAPVVMSVHGAMLAIGAHASDSKLLVTFVGCQSVRNRRNLPLDTA